ncbi:DUF6879 family protein [Nocardiopsis sp. NPDC058631]|uniref:DUF6879 family protein n=1 Tax=Nocardiopsis sp. NPDC058631 TaxID=3346566 RepID=UPI0036667DBA
MARLPGERLDAASYRQDFSARFWSVRDSPVWKLERQQVFHQPESDSWIAFLQGRPEESLRLLEARRPALREQFDRLAQAGCSVRRVRVVEQPFPTYLLWELHSLRVRAQCGEDIRVISPDPLAAFERERPVPEIVVLGDEVTYKILYDAEGVAEGAVRFTDPAVIEGCRPEIAALHQRAEVLEDYFVREVSESEATRAR